MQNKWTASVTNTKSTKEDNKGGITPEKNHSKKIGLAMGIVGAILVVAGSAPMLFGNSDNLTGDTTGQKEAVDPLVALLSEGNSEKKSPSQTPAKTATNQANTTLHLTIKPTPTKQSISATPHTTPAATPVHNTTLQKAPSSDTFVKVTNDNTGTTDKQGRQFHNSSALVNSSNGNIHVTNGIQSVSITGNEASITNGSQSVSIKNHTQTTIKPPKNIQTGFDSNMLLGLLFLFASGVFLLRSQKPTFYKK